MIGPIVARSKDSAESYYGRKLTWIKEGRKRVHVSKHFASGHKGILDHDGRWIAVTDVLGCCLAHVYDNHDDFIRMSSVSDILRD